jgi:hypothetical protein
MGAGAKIYGYWVDNLHFHSYSLLNGLNRNQNSKIDLIQSSDDQDESS